MLILSLSRIWFYTGLLASLALSLSTSVNDNDAHVSKNILSHKESEANRTEVRDPPPLPPNPQFHKNPKKGVGSVSQVNFGEASNETPGQVHANVAPVQQNFSSTIAPKNSFFIPDGTVVRNFSNINSGAVLRMFYVFVGLSVIVVMYLVVRSVRLNRKRSTRVHKYGVLASREDVEMTPLGMDDDDEDTIVFDLSNHPQH